jgi:RNase adaptor protein for sRNA GlmZ degradation
MNIIKIESKINNKMPSSKKVKLIYNFYENDIVYAYDGFKPETKIDNDFDYNKILLDSIKDIMYNKNRNLTIYSWGILRHDEPKCEISFDLTKFTTKTDIKYVKLLNGKDEEIQHSIIQHPLFTELLQKIIEEIETNNPTEISFFCNHGKHRSVGWTEILKKYYYPNSIIKHSIK